jgi:hypothetical protein
MAQPKGYIIDRGLSPINGQPYVVVLTLKSNNRKTGDMAQAWILCEDINPVEAVQTGKDTTICGNCPHRKNKYGKRSCYVNVGQGPNSIWKAYKRGSYVDATGWELTRYAAILNGKRIRWGAYGDPSIIKPGIVHTLSAYADGHTGYTHQWREEFSQAFKGLFQASCDGFADYLEASSKGWKTFTVVPKHTSITKNSYAKQCPATVENSVAQCATCKLCDGNRADIYVHAHGTGAKYVVVA